MCWRLAITALLAVIVPLGGASAQRTEGDTAKPTSNRGRLAITGCAGQVISDVVVITQPPYTERLPQQLEFVRRVARDVHSTTRPEVVRRFLLLKAGDACNQIRRAESERILRAQPFLVDARITVFDDDAGGVVLEVETRDEFSVIFSTAIVTTAPIVRALRVGNSNIAGSARLLSAEWRDGRAYDDVWAARYTDYQLLGERNELRLIGARLLRGQETRIEVVRPYYTDLQRLAFLASVDGRRGYATFRRAEGPDNSVNVARQTAVLGGIARIGSVGRLKLVGLSLTQSRERVDSTTVVIERDGFRPGPSDPLGVDFRRQNVVRANLLGGVRLLRFTPAQGFDALTGTQDLRVGLQVGAVYGHALGVASGVDRDRFMSAGVYGGVGNAKAFVGLQFVGEARNDLGNRTWDNHIVSGRVAWYFRPAVRQTTVLSTEWSSGRDMRTPFQLAFAELQGGLLAHRNSRAVGAERLIARLEQRMVLPSRRNVADFGLAAFAEAGRLWRERSVPYAVTTPFRGAVGFSLMAAVPPRSRRLWRADFAFPVGSDPNSRFEVRFSNEDRTREFWREPRDVEVSRERALPRSLFTWP